MKLLGMLKVLYNAKDKGAVIVLLAIIGFVYYDVKAFAEKKNDAAVTKIEKQATATRQVDKKIDKVLAMLDALGGTVQDLKDSVKTTEDRVWKIGRDVYVIKKQTN